LNGSVSSMIGRCACPERMAKGRARRQTRRYKVDEAVHPHARAIVRVAQAVPLPSSELLETSRAVVRRTEGCTDCTRTTKARPEGGWSPQAVHTGYVFAATRRTSCATVERQPTRTRYSGRCPDGQGASANTKSAITVCHQTGEVVSICGAARFRFAAPIMFGMRGIRVRFAGRCPAPTAGRLEPGGPAGAAVE
jgi:hypothetical protein